MLQLGLLVKPHQPRQLLHGFHNLLNAKSSAISRVKAVLEYSHVATMPPKTKTASKSKSDQPSLKPPDPPLDAPALDDKSLRFSYEIARGEMGVLSFEPYKSLILPYWAFRTVPIATNSAETLWAIFESYVERGDLVGADMTRKYIQMGMTRARRYANHKGGLKYGKDGEQLKKWTGNDADGKRREKEEASEIFKGYWRRCIADEQYTKLKEAWQKEKKQWLKARNDSED